MKTQNAIGHERADAGEADKDIKTVNRSASTYERKERGVPEFQLVKAIAAVKSRSARASVVDGGTSKSASSAPCASPMSVYDYFASIGK